MENKTIFVITLKGEGELKNHTHQLPEDLKRVLALVDDESRMEVLAKRAAPSLRAGLQDALQHLEKNGYIRDKASPISLNMPKIAKPKTAPPQPVMEEADDLDFTSAIKVRAEAEEKVEQEAEAIRLKKEQAAAAKVQLEAAQAKAEADARVRAEAEAKAKQEAQAARLKAEQASTKARAEAEAAQNKAEQEAKKAKAELETARVEAERVRAELETARIESEALTKREAEVARLREEAAAAKAQAEAEIERIKAEREAALTEARTLQKTEAARIMAEAEAKAKQDMEAVRRKAEEDVAQARAEAEAARIKAEQDAAQARAEIEARITQEAEARAKQEAEAARRAAEEEIAKARAEVEAARIKAEQDAAKAKSEAEAKAKQDAEAARLKAEQETAKAREEAAALARQEAENARIKAEQEIARVKAEAEEQIRLAAQAKVNAESALAAKIKAETAAARSMIATVLFFDIVGYTKQSVSKQIELKKQFNQLVSEFIKEVVESQRIILDTGDGAAIGFLQHPEDAIEVALKFRTAVTGNRHSDYPDLKVRIGIHLGPVNVVKDMNGQSNMVGDGINDAQRIMSFASSDQIYISRSYYDIVSRLNAEYAKLFQYCGVKNDKHGRQHQVYEAVTEEAKKTAPEVLPPDTRRSAEAQDTSAFSIQLDPSLLDNLGASTSPSPPAPQPLPDTPASSAAEDDREITIDLQLPLGESPEENARKAQQEAEARAQAEKAEQAERAKAEKQAQQEAEAARLKAEAEAKAAHLKAERDAAKAEKEARELANEQAKTWAQAEQRAKAQAATEVATAQAAQRAAAPVQQVSHVRRKPLPLGKIAAGVLVLLLALVAALPYVWPMQGYVAPLEAKLSAQLQQPVHISSMKAALFPLPKLELQSVSIGSLKELNAAKVTLNFGMAALFSETRPIGNAEVEGLVLDSGSFVQSLSWLQAAGKDPHYPIARMTLIHARIGDSSLPPLSGGADMDGQGHISKAVLRSDDGKLDLDLQRQQASWQVALRIKESSLPILPNIQFNELNIKGEIGENAADLSGLEGHLYGGMLSGNARLSWQDGWRLQGRIAIRQMELQQALSQSGIEGTLDGDGSFTLGGESMLRAAQNHRLDGSFVVGKGVISKMDMVETAAQRQSINGGRTHFEEMSGTLQVENDSSHLRQLRISSGAMNTSGSVDISHGEQLSGRLSVDLKMRPGSAALTLSGTVNSPVLRP